MGIQDYIDYFKHQAETHPDLLHDDASGQRVFALVTVEQAMGDFRTGAQTKATIVRLLEYSYVVDDQGKSQNAKAMQGGFIVASYYSARSGGDAAYIAAMAKSERIADEIIEKMITDSQAGHPLFDYSLDSRQQIQVNPIRNTGDATYVGFIVLFAYENFFRVCTTHDDAPAWTDGGQTPY